MTITCFLDDGLANSGCFEAALRKSKTVKNSLTNARFIVNDKKSAPEFSVGGNRHSFIRKMVLYYTFWALDEILDIKRFLNTALIAKVCGILFATKFVLPDMV